MKQVSTNRPARWAASLLAAAALATPACAQDVLSSIATLTDEFTQNSAAEIDVLWVVDNSESMAEEQAGLGDSFQAFINNLIASNVDYHIGVISTDTADGGQLHSGSRGVPFIHPEIADPQGAFLENVQVGIDGARAEKAFESAALALGKGLDWQPGDPINDPNTAASRAGTCTDNRCEGHDATCAVDSDCDQKFLRDAAALFIIMVSDEEDNSFGPITYYWRLFEGYKGPGNESRISVSAIVGPPGEEGGCIAPGRGNAAPGDRYVDLANQTGGIYTSICADFADSLRELSITAAGLKSVFVLSSLPDAAASIPCDGEPSDGFCVRVDGRAVRGNNGAGWSYEPGRNAIIFGVNALPPPQASITIEYREARGS